MSNKGWDKINPLDRDLRKAFGAGMFTGVKVRIEMVNGFELFNTRPYHNYETWSDGYQVTVYSRDTDDPGKPLVFAVAEDLDDAIALAIKRAQCDHDLGRVDICKKCGHHQRYVEVHATR